MFPSTANRSFNPDDLTVLCRVFQECCREAIVMRSPPPTPTEEHVLKMCIGKVLMLTYASGVHDPKAMKHIALQVAV